MNIKFVDNDGNILTTKEALNKMRYQDLDSLIKNRLNNNWELVVKLYALARFWGTL